MKQRNKSMIVIMQTTGASGRLQYKDKKKVDRRNLTGGRKKYTQAYLCT